MYYIESNKMFEKIQLCCYIGASKEVQKQMKRAFLPFFSSIGCYGEVIQLQNIDSNDAHRDSTLDKWGDMGKLVAPSLAIMLFAPERGSDNADTLRTELIKPPWTLHHTVKLQKISSPGCIVAQQDFYELSPELPLWSVCPTMEDQQYLRINIFVINFYKMVEFYRLITNVEMESSKAGFCFFQLGTSTDQKLHLSLKHCPSLHPRPPAGAHLHFKVSSIKAIQFIIHSDIKDVSHSVYSVMDPDGNTIFLTDDAELDIPTNKDVLGSDATYPSYRKSVKSSSDSQVSGLFSDSHQGRINVQCSSNLPCECQSADGILTMSCVFDALDTESLASNRTSLLSSVKAIHPVRQGEMASSPASIIAEAEETDFEDPWEGSQYNESVNPSREYKVLPMKKPRHKSSNKEPTLKNYKSSNGTNVVSEVDLMITGSKVTATRLINKENGLCEKCGPTQTGNSKCISQINEQTTKVAGIKDHINLCENPAVHEPKSQNKIINQDQTSISSEHFHIFPDEGYHDSIACGQHFVRSQSCDMLSLKSFHAPKRRSISQIISDKFFTKEKKFRAGIFKSVDHLEKYNPCWENFHEKDLWDQNPKLFQILGPPHSQFHGSVEMVLKKIELTNEPSNAAIGRQKLFW